MTHSEVRTMKSATGSFLYDPESMQIYTEDGKRSLLPQGRSSAVVANDYVKVTINVVKGCNLSCQYCPYGGSGPDMGRMEKMSKNVGVSIIDFLCSAFPQPIKLIKVSFTSNGEPVLNLEVINVIKAYARNLQEQNPQVPKFRFDFATNSIALTEKTLEILGQDPDQRVFFSVDGYPELHDRIRTMCSGKSSYELVAKKVLFYRKHSKSWGKQLTSSTVLTALDEHYDRILTHLDEMGFESIVTRPIRGAVNTSLGLNANTVEHFINGYKRMIDLVEGPALAGDIKLLRKLCNRYDFFGRLFSALILGEERQQGCPGCPSNYLDAARYTLVFDIDGDIYFPCRDFIGHPDYYLGNISGNLDLSGLRNAMEALRTANRPTCQDCWARTMCGGGCYNAALLSSGQITYPDPNLCRIIIYLAERSVQLAHAMAILQPEKLQQLVALARESSPWHRSE